MADKLTHDGTIKTDDMQPGYVWMRCNRWELPCNTGDPQWHVFYRPLAGAAYKGNELVTSAMREAIEQHNATPRPAPTAPAKSRQQQVEWRSPRGKTLTQEIDSVDSLY